MSANKRTSEVLALLCTRWPRTFFHYEIRRKPLKLGIHHEIAAALGESVEKKLLSGALRRYVANYGYAQKIGAERIDLDGNPAGVVTEKDAENAARWMAWINTQQKQKRRLEKKKPPPEPRRDGLASLREAAAARRQRQAAVGGGA